MRVPILSGLTGHDRVGHGAFHAFIREVTPSSGMRADMDYVGILATSDDRTLASLWSVGKVKLERLRESRERARALIRSGRTTPDCRGCEGTCCTGVGSDPCTCPVFDWEE
jgi:hypothetical protein